MDDMAIKYDEIPNMQNAIESYTVAVEGHLNKIRGFEIGKEEGIYGAAQIATIDNYIDETANQINSIVRHFDEFKEKLLEVQAAYEAHQAAIKTADVEAAPEDAGDLVTVNKMD